MIKDLEYRTGLRENFDDYLSNYFENSYNAKGMVESLKRGATYRPRIHSQYNSAPARCKTYTRKSFLLALYFFSSDLQENQIKDISAFVESGNTINFIYL